MRLGEATMSRRERNETAERLLPGLPSLPRGPSPEREESGLRPELLWTPTFGTR